MLANMLERVYIYYVNDVVKCSTCNAMGTDATCKPSDSCVSA